MPARLSTLALPVLAALALGACGGDDGGGGSGDGRPAGQVVDTGNPAPGKEVYAANCAACHGPDGGGGTGPRLQGEEAYTDAEVVVSQIRDGGGGMPAFGDKLSARELSDVSAFIVKDLAR